jgi:hypothetical protein
MSILDAATTWTLDKLSASYRRRHNPVYRTVDRFRLLISAHKLEITQILRFVPKEWKWSLAQLQDDAALLQALDLQKLSWFAKWLGVKLDWLEGTSDQIYGTFRFYKRIGLLPKMLARRRLVHEGLEIVAFADSAEPLDMNARFRQELALVFSVPIATIGDTEIRRFVVSTDNWPWDHAPCRWDLKMLARAASNLPATIIPIIPVPRKTVVALYKGERFPAQDIPSGIGRFEQLEDYGLTAAEGGNGRESDDLTELLRQPARQLASLFPAKPK